MGERKPGLRRDPVRAAQAFVACVNRHVVIRNRLDTMVANLHGAEHSGQLEARMYSVPVSALRSGEYWMDLLYASMCPIMEGWRCLHYEDAEVDGLLTDADKAEALRLFRNAVWHFGAADAPDILAMKRTPELQAWALSLSAAVTDFLRRLGATPVPDLPLPPG